MTTPLLDLLVPSATLLNVACDDKEAVIKLLSQQLLDANYILDSYETAVLEREATMPTGLPLEGDTNVAIPHTDVEHVAKPGIALATVTAPVLFQSMAEPEVSLPVRIIILMALSEAKGQVETLMAIAELIQNQSVIDNLLLAESYEDVVKAISEPIVA